MKKSNRPAWPVIIAALMVCAALALTVYSRGDIDDNREHIERRRAHFQRLQELHVEQAGRRNAVDDLLADRSGTLPDLTALLRTHLPGVQPDVIMRESIPVDGRELQGYDIRLEEIKSGDLAAFLEACAAARPPARVLSIAVSPSRQGATDRVQAQLTVIALR